jgi:dTMP kinase
MFFSLDGLDGAGKSTQLKQFREWLAERGLDVVTCRDPGTTAVGEAVRKLLLDVSHQSLSRRAEMLLYMAARAQLVDEVISPAIAAGKTVLSDRYLLANVVYQGYAGGLDVQELWQIGHLATRGVMPDLTLVLDISPEAASQRMARPLDRMEQSGDEFRRRVREGFLTEAARRPDTIVVVDASGDIDHVQAALRAAAERVLG